MSSEPVEPSQPDIPTGMVLQRVPTGYRVWRGWVGGLLLGNVSTKEHRGLYRDGVTQYEDMQRSSWSIHFTSPGMLLDDLRAVVAALPTEA